KEVRELRKWIHSPAHNQREDVQILFNYLFEKNNLTKNRQLKKEKVFAAIFPNEPYNDAKMRQVIHFFLKSVEEFLIYQEHTKDEVRRKIELAGIYRNRRLGRLCEGALNQARDLLDKSPFQNSRFLKNYYSWELERYYYLSGSQRKEINLQEVSDALDTSFFADKLQQSCFMLAHQAVYKTEYDRRLIEEILNFVEEKSLLHYPAIAVYYYGYKAMLEKEDEAHFFNLKKEIEKNEHCFPPEELKVIYLMSINYCIKKLNAGKREFYRESFELYRRGFEKMILIENNLLSRWTFLNVVMIGTFLKEYDWIASFVHEYQTFLEEKYRENTVHYALAKLNFEKGDYDKAMRLLVKYESDDIIMNLNAKTLLLKMLYEENEYNALESLVESMRAYMQRKKVMGYHKAQYSNVAKLTRKLIKTNFFDRTQIEKLKTEIENASPLTNADRSWLLKQLA
ncbi:MAG: hypothetical protein D6714_21530, partial [Bacteroidetes bacterium]